jgi:hypothetical protein
MAEYPIDTSEFTQEQKNLAQSVFVELLEKAGVSYDDLKFDADKSAFIIDKPSVDVAVPPDLILRQLQIDDELRSLFADKHSDTEALTK